MRWHGLATEGFPIILHGPDHLDVALASVLRERDCG